MVTGSSGFLGHHLCRKLIELGFYVVGVDDMSNGTEEYCSIPNEFGRLKVGDLRLEDLSGVKYIFHTAALPRVPFSVEFPEETHDANVNQTLKLLLLARDVKIEKVIYSSSSSVYGGQTKLPSKETMTPVPLSPYAVQKLAAEHYCEVFRGVYGLQTASLRYFNVYGEEQRADNPYTGVITKFKQMKKDGKPLTIFGNGEQRRDFTFVQDVVEANILVAEKGIGVFNVGTGTNHSINEIAKAISNNVEYLPARLGDPMISLADNSKLQSIGWKPKMELLKWLS